MTAEIKSFLEHYDKFIAAETASLQSLIRMQLNIEKIRLPAIAIIEGYETFNKDAQNES